MLTATAVRQAKPADKTRRLYDEKGLYLELTKAGGRYWRLKYRWEGKEKRLALGVYPDVSLAKARQRRDEARALLTDGVDPSAQRKAEKAAQGGAESFEAVAREWFAKQSATWKPSHASRIMLRLENDVFPWMGNCGIGDITAPEILTLLRRIESRGAVESAHRVKQNIGQVMRYAVATGRAERNPAADLRGALTPVKPKHLPAITKPGEVAELLRAMDSYQGSLITRCALRLAPLVFVRPGELRKAEWAEIDLEACLWSIPAEKMKGGQPHLVPLSGQAMAVLRELEPLTGSGRYVFPSPRSAARPMSNNAITAALRRMGYEQGSMTGHGFRAMARTLLDEALHAKPELIEHQLAHTVRDPLGRAYNRTTHLPERTAMMQQWADYLDTLKAGGNVVPLHSKAS